MPGGPDDADTRERQLTAVVGEIVLCVCGGSATGWSPGPCGARLRKRETQSSAGRRRLSVQSEHAGHDASPLNHAEREPRPRSRAHGGKTSPQDSNGNPPGTGGAPD